MKIGVFDSGIGGEAVAKSLESAFPKATIITVNDKANVPYGDKSSKDVIRLTDTAIQPLLQEKCSIIILACNTATALAITTLRSRYPNQKFIGIEPMIKTASELTKSHVIAACATPATLASDRYKSLIKTHGQHLTIIEPDCSNWAYMIEHDQINIDQIRSTVQNIHKQGADVIVLGCTHYHWIKDLILQAAGSSIQVIEPSEAIASRVRHLMAL
ncbi:MAG TPA: glutamate racemase [Candidatus Saccharimonadales bacterium]|nr:glutamate racemase [Candidatus Saccharimonadales bacterium]